MYHVNEKYFALHSQLRKDNFWQKMKFEKCDMTSVNLEKTLEYLKIQESWRAENLTEYY